MANALQKVSSGIEGLDEITYGGLPKGRPILVCGSAGAGKTMFGIEFLVCGATEHGEPGVLMSFEEKANELAANAASLDYDLDELVASKKIFIDFVRVERSEIEETGEYDLSGLFIRLETAIKAVHAKRVVLDTIETLFAGLSNTAILRAELRRLFRWLKDKGVTTVITAERGDGTLTRHGLEEYISDCVILLDHRVSDQLSTRRLRVVKYRGSEHGTNEYPFIIDRDGFSVFPITSLGLSHNVSKSRVSTGIPDLDSMLDGKGLYVGTSVLVSGTAGTGKTTVATSFSAAACKRGERTLYFAFEESPNQIARNMESVGINLAPCIKSKRLKIQSSRPSATGLEAHLAEMFKQIQDFDPQNVVIDPISNLVSVATSADVRSMLTRLIDFLKTKQRTAIMTTVDGLLEDAGSISSLVDTWILLSNIELGGERNRGLYILKSRGMPHSNQIREFLLTKQGVRLREAYLGPEGVLTGSARVAQEAKERMQAVDREQDTNLLKWKLEQERKAAEAQIAAIKAALASKEQEIHSSLSRQQSRLGSIKRDRDEMAVSRKANFNGGQ